MGVQKIFLQNSSKSSNEFKHKNDRTKSCIYRRYNQRVRCQPRKKTFTFLLLFIGNSLVDSSNVILPDVGTKQGIFASLAQLEILWYKELKVVDLMEKLLTTYKPKPSCLQLYVNNHYLQNLNQTPNYLYLGHPINAYHLIRHIASDWRNIITNDFLDTGNQSLMTDIDHLRKSFDKLHPDIRDIKGGALGMVRLWAEYRIDLTEMTNNGKISTTMANDNKVQSESSAVKLDAFDIYLMASQAIAHNFFHAAVVFYELLSEKLEGLIGEHTMRLAKLWNIRLSHTNIKRQLALSIKQHDEKLVKFGPLGAMHQCNNIPFALLENYTDNQVNIAIQSREKLVKYLNYQRQGNGEKVSQFHRASVVQSKKLCNGGQIRDKKERSSLRCAYHSRSKWLELGPFKIEINSNDPFHITIKELIQWKEAEQIVQNITQGLTTYKKRKHRLIKKGDWTDVRIMKNVVVREEDNINLFDKVNRRVTHISRLNANTTMLQSERMLCGNYGIGGSYWNHIDYNDPAGDGRVATLIHVLEAPTAGGATIWPYAGISVFPEKGDGIFWHNLYKGSQVDYFATHKACSVLLGNKWIGNKWIGINGQWNISGCSLYRDTLFSW